MDSDDSCEDDSDSDAEGGGKGERAIREAAFTKVLKDMMDKREKAEPGVLQEVSRGIMRWKGATCSCSYVSVRWF